MLLGNICIDAIGGIGIFDASFGIIKHQILNAINE